MSLVGRVLSALRGPAAVAPKADAPRRRRGVQGSYDNAQSGGENAEHWAWADALNANAANDPSTRKVLRERSRYECDNNGYAGGLVKKLGNDLIGTRPRLQLSVPGADRKAARVVEKAFSRWARRVNLGQKLRLLDNAAVRDGEGFALLTTNPRLPIEGVQLDLRLYETDQVDTPWFNALDETAFPGGRLDDHGNVSEWHFLRAHPGSPVWWGGMYEFDTIPAGRVLHWFAPTRAGQLRGIPEIGSSLSLYAILRRYTLATLGAAEFAASIAGVLETQLPPDGTAPTIEEMDEIDIPRRKLLTLPAGQTARPFDTTQPTTGYKDFKSEILAESGSPVGAPRNVSTGSSAEYNYSSGRLDHGLYQRGVSVRRSDIAEPNLDQIFAMWLDEAALVGLIPDGLPPFNEWGWVWYFDGFMNLDPQKEATANKTRLENGETNLMAICAEAGEDWEEVTEQRQRELDRQRELRQANRPAVDPTATPGASPPGSPAAPAGLSDSQVSTVLKILDRVSSEAMTPEAAAALIRVTLPTLTPEQIGTFVRSAEAAPPPAAPPTAAKARTRQLVGVQAGGNFDESKHSRDDDGKFGSGGGGGGGSGSGSSDGKKDSGDGEKKKTPPLPRIEATDPGGIQPEPRPTPGPESGPGS